MVTELFSSGHTACTGCGQALGARLVVETTGPNVIIANATGCLEVFTSRYPESAWGVPWIHSLFQNAAAVASGIEAALRIKGKLDQVRVISQGGTDLLPISGWPHYRVCSIADMISCMSVMIMKPI